MIKRHFFSSILISFLVAIFFSCSEEIIEPPSMLFGADFYPLQKGHFVDYRVEQITYKEFEPTDTSIFYLREEVGDTITEFTSSGTVQKLFRYTRSDTLLSWQLDSVWTVRNNFNRIVKVENNIPLIKLALPVDLNSTWNGNALNSLEPQFYSLDNFLFLNEEAIRIFRVLQQNDSSLVDKNVAWEVYGEGIGLIESLRIDVEYISDITDPFYGTDSIRRGVYTNLKAIDFSN